MPLSFPTNGNSAEVVGQVGNLRRVGNPPEPPVNKLAGAGCQPARRIPSCPTIHAGCSASRTLSGIGQDWLPHWAAPNLSHQEPGTYATPGASNVSNLHYLRSSMTRLVRGPAVALLLLPWCFGQPQRLPVKRVVLYKNGVGYFEHVGQVRGNQEVTIPFTSGQLNDVLKSLTVLDLGGGRITGVAYGSAAPVDRQLGDLRLPVGEKSSLTEFLNALRGARLEIKSGATSMTGRLLSVERKTRIAGGTTLEVDYVSLLTESGELDR